MIEKKNVLTHEEYKAYMDNLRKTTTSKLNSRDRYFVEKHNERVKNKDKKITSYGGRGLAFEGVIDASNDYYKEKGIALIRKIPTPVKVLKIGDKGNIEKGFYEKKSALDFNGLLKGGVHIDFDTKETSLKTMFKFSLVHEHQKEYIKEVEALGGISFILVNFKLHDECYLLRYKDVKEYLEYNKGKSSIEYTYFRDKLKHHRVEKRVFKQGYIYDYLKVVENLYNISL